MIRKIIPIFIIALLFSCEKAINIDDDGSNKEEKTTTSVNSANDIDPISVDSAINTSYGTNAYVEGFIVGACSKSISNAEFKIPAQYSQSILIADKPNEQNTQHIIAVCLTDRSTIRKELNLVDNKSNMHKLIGILGTLSKYLGTHGLKEIQNYQFYSTIDSL